MGCVGMMANCALGLVTGRELADWIIIGVLQILGRMPFDEYVGIIAAERLALPCGYI